MFGTVLSKNTALKELDLRFNRIGKHGARFLANGMVTNTNLDVLKLDKNSLGAAGAHYLATMLAGSSCTLKELHLFCNVIRILGVVFSIYNGSVLPLSLSLSLTLSLSMSLVRPPFARL